MRPGKKSKCLPYHLESRFRICDDYGFLVRLLLFVPDIAAPILGFSLARLPPETQPK
jgi:hypothetical protein